MNNKLVISKPTADIQKNFVAFLLDYVECGTSLCWFIKQESPSQRNKSQFTVWNMWFTCSKTNYIWWCLYNKTRRSIMINTILNINLRPEWILHHFYKFFATVTKAYSSILFIVSNYHMQSPAVFQNIL